MPNETELQYAAVTEAYKGKRDSLFAKEDIVRVAKGHKTEEGKDAGERFAGGTVRMNKQK